jgi:phosphoribosyl 1,2-cyclic phosphate phosphodiesterase
LSNNKCIILGTGTSQGVPIIGCTCEVCLSNEDKDVRLRSSALLSIGSSNIIIDTGPDFRQQMLRHKVDHLDGILLTHEHNDHVAGLDDIRPFNYMQKESIALFTSRRVIDDLKTKYNYIFAEERYPGAPSINLNEIGQESFMIDQVSFQPIHYMHGSVPVIGFRVGDMAYITDIKFIEDTEIEKLKGVRNLIVGALHHRAHHSHFNLSEALTFAQKVNPEYVYITHISHYMGCYTAVNKTLPKGVQLAYDGLEIEISL